MGKYIKHGVDLKLLIIINLILLAGNIMFAIPRELRDMTNHNTATHQPQWSFIYKDRLNLIKGELLDYYVQYDKYPDEKYFYNHIIKKDMKYSHKYANNQEMVRSYRIINLNKANESYEIRFNDYPGTSVDESKFVLTNSSDTSKL